MRRSLLMFVGLSFGLLVMVVSVVHSVKPKVLARDAGDEARVIVVLGEQNDDGDLAESATESETKEWLATESGVVATSIAYELPYPGLLPNHPLYWLKMVRDRIQLLMTRDPLSRISLLLLHADKRLGAALALTTGGQYDLAEETAIKAEGYWNKAAIEIMDLPENQEQGLLLGRRVELAGKKHVEALRTLQELFPDQNKSAIAHLITAGTARVDELSSWLGEAGGVVEEVDVVTQQEGDIDFVQVVEDDPRF